MRNRRLAKGVLVLLALCMSLCVAAADSRYRLQVSGYELSFASLPRDFDGFRIVHLTDLHGMSFGADNSRLVSRVKEQKPDLIALTGDFADDGDGLRAAEALLKGLEGIEPVYWVNGNHEWRRGGTENAMQELVERYGGKCLNDAYEPFYRNSGKIVIAGSDDPNTWHGYRAPEELAEELRGQYPKDFVLWLGHRNFWVRDFPDLPAELILCGHAHGGMIRLPGIGGLVSTDRSLGAKYESGLYFGNGLIMEVSRGLGSSGPVPRLFNRPEIAVITLRAGA